jgi:GT2 family glycosyltransferase
VKAILGPEMKEERHVDVSVIVPVYNGGDQIAKCVEALKRQKTALDYEIVVVDDGSDDGATDKLIGDNVRVVKQARQGPAVARNLGAEQSRGDVILFTDADCEPLENWIEEMVRPFSDPGVSGVKGCYLSNQRELLARFVQIEYERKYERMNKDRFIDFIDTYSAAFLKRDFLAAGGYDPAFPFPSVEDQEFSFRMWAKGYKMVFNPSAKVYHTHARTLRHYVKKKFRIGYWKALVLRKHPEKILRDSHTPQTLKVEMIFAFLFLVSLPLLLINPEFLFLSGLSLSGFLLVASWFFGKSFAKDPAVAIFSPLILFLRALSLGLGLISGAFAFHGVGSSGT